jgi:hypothetical protein
LSSRHRELRRETSSQVCIGIHFGRNGEREDGRLRDEVRVNDIGYRSANLGAVVNAGKSRILEVPMVNERPRSDTLFVHIEYILATML